MFELLVNGIKKYMEATLILKNITFQAYAGEKIGIVGANGSGKSTMLKLIAGIEPMNYWPGYPQTSSYGYDEGFISVPDTATVSYLEQIPQYSDNVKVIDVLKLAFEEIHQIEKKMRLLEEQMSAEEGEALGKIMKQYSNLAQTYEIKGGYNTEEKLSRICTGLNFTESFLQKDFSLLSGGEKTTVVLGKLLMDNPDILLLDEPTNHLDLNAIEWLEEFLKNYKGIVIIVSHDRYFLDNVVTKMVEFEDMESICYKGNYSAYAKQKEENLRVQFDNFQDQQKQIKAMEKTIKELRDWAARADNNKFFRRAASIQIKLDKMKRIERPVFDRANMKLDLKAKQRSGNETIKAVAVSKRFGDKTILHETDLLVQYSERVALVGPNGCGKTTFIKMLLGEEQVDSGLLKLGVNTMTAYLPQSVTFEDEELTVLECFRDDISILEGKAREYLSKYMFFGNGVFKKVKQLSGGEKIRLKLAQLLYEDVNLLILDEPTNHLDIDSIETFEEALEDFKGTIFFISHDRFFINKIAGRVVAFEDYTLRSYDGNYDSYKTEIKRLREMVEEPDKKGEKGKSSAHTTINKSKFNIGANTSETNVIKRAKAAGSNDKRRRKADSIDESKRVETQLKQIEERVEGLENEIKELDEAMLTEGLDYNELNELYCRKTALTAELEAVMELWLEIPQ